ncbi:hypothetical protein KP509_11G033800 [Ceratopteris richardii]|uniref:Divinyl chlorophyllide a 8-vinyl-reductase, chloroplastic n=1 Tax=Ceratopteris richardii TaxID=49495 RepID=A0A8T2TNN2_CERRI|nr:hypothetical protein KP509_11G033800 [Ceratopteris richardii]
MACIMKITSMKSSNYSGSSRLLSIKHTTTSLDSRPKLAFLSSSIGSSSCFPQLAISSNNKINAFPSQGYARRSRISCMALPTGERSEINVLVVGSTGYIGKFVVKELVRRGYNVIAVARERSGIGGKSSKDDAVDQLEGAHVCFADVTDVSSLTTALQSTCEKINGRFHVVVSCLASRTGGVKDSWKIDYDATMNSLIAGRKLGASHFVLLSAICVQKPLLEFQKAKLKFEAELQKLAETDVNDENGGFTYSIVRPTAFFKSLAGQVETVKNGQPYVMFGDGALCACKPISESDLASFISDCISDLEKVNRILPIGGPGEALTPRQQGEMLFQILGKEPRFLQVPIQIMDFAIGLLDFLVKFFPSLEDAAEFGKIGRYYAAESMLVYDPETGKYDADATPSYGQDTLEVFFKRVVEEGLAGQELGDQAVFKSS